MGSIEVVADDPRVEPGWRPGQAEILQHHHRIAMMGFAHDGFERVGDACRHRAAAARRTWGQFLNPNILGGRCEDLTRESVVIRDQPLGV